MKQATQIDSKAAQALIDSKPWWYHKFEIFPGLWTPGVYDPSGTLSMLKLPEDMNGMRVLEIGPADGYFTKVMSSRGANVIAIDCVAKDHYGFGVMESLSGQTYDYRECNIFALDDLRLGAFDLVLCLGVLYHLPDPVRAIWTLSHIPTNKLILETLVSRKYDDQCIAEYLPAASCNGDDTNFWAPTPKCCEMIIADIGYSVDSVWLNDTRAMFHCSAEEKSFPTRKMNAAYSGVRY